MIVCVVIVDIDYVFQVIFQKGFYLYDRICFLIDSNFYLFEIALFPGGSELDDKNIFSVYFFRNWFSQRESAL